MITKLETPGPGQRQYSSTWLTYAANGAAVTFAVGEEWDWDGDVLNQATNYNITYGRAFRYDGGRQRYLHRTLNPSALMTGFITTLGDVWSDYSGDSIYGDYTVAFDGSTSAVTETTSRQPGIGMTPWNAAGIDPSATEYYNSDMIGTLRAKTDATGSALAGPNLPDPGPVFTAFGEQVGGNAERYGYAGAWGYQTDDSAVVDKFPFQHVGARYYDPEIGRFLQRDPIGIDGGVNVYAYVRNRPTGAVDSSGLELKDDLADVAGMLAGLGGAAALGGGVAGPSEALFAASAIVWACSAALNFGDRHGEDIEIFLDSLGGSQDRDGLPDNDCRHCHYNGNDRANDMRLRSR